MTFDMDRVAKDLDGKPHTADGKDLTLRTICVTALTAPDQQADGPEKFMRYQLAQRIHPGGLVDLTAEELALLKVRIGATYMSPAAVGPAFEMLESPAGPEAEE